jgi:hypothetical protein
VITLRDISWLGRDRSGEASRGLRKIDVKRDGPFLPVRDAVHAQVRERRPVHAGEVLERAFRGCMAVMSQCDHVDVWCYGLSGGLVVLA